MSFLHKYIADGKEFFMVSEESSKPSGIIRLTQNEWQGRAISGKSLALKQLSNAKFSKEEEIEELPKGKKSCVSKVVRDLVSSIKE